MNTVTRTFRVYGATGHRQAESFNPSVNYNWSTGDKIRILCIKNADVTKKNDYSEIQITRNTRREVEYELNGQLSDGIFENYRYGIITELFDGQEFEINYDDFGM